MTNFTPSQTERVCRRQFYFDKKWQKFSKPKENTVGKGEISRYEQFSFSQCFHKTVLWTHKKPGLVWEKVTVIYPCSADFYFTLASDISPGDNWLSAHLSVF